MELARKMNSLADTVACMQRQADQVTQTILSVNTAIYEIVQGGNGDYGKLRDTLNDLTLELGTITQCAEDAEDANQALSEEAETTRRQMQQGRPTSRWAHPSQAQIWLQRRINMTLGFVRQIAQVCEVASSAAAGGAAGGATSAGSSSIASAGS